MEEGLSKRGFPGSNMATNQQEQNPYKKKVACKSGGQ